MQLPRCEKCNSRYIAQQKRLWCQVCGNTRTDAEAEKLLHAYYGGGGTDTYTPDYVPTVRINGPTDEELHYLRAAWSAMHKQDMKTGRYLCQQVLDKNPLLIDALLLMAEMAETRDKKLQYLLSILTVDRTHERANFEIAKMKGVIPAQVTFRPGNFATAASTATPVEAQGQVEQCPMCGGKTLYVAGETVKCRACGYQPGQVAGMLTAAALPTTLPADGLYHPLQDALMQRKYGISKQWQITQRVVACHNCGSQLTLSGNMLTQQCTFCDSQHVLVRDAVGSFQQPDALVPGRVQRRQVEGEVYQAVSAPIRARASRVEIVGVYLPFWCFQGMVNLRTAHDQAHSVAAKNILVSGSQEPGDSILADLQPYDLGDLRPYDQRYLADWSANLYTLDAIQASITANAFAKYYAAQQVRGTPPFDAAPFARADKNYSPFSGMFGVQDFTEIALVGTLEYRLLLLPVWMIALYLDRGESYHGIVNAQTGEVIFTERLDSRSSYSSQKDQPASVIRPLQRENRSVIRPLPPRR